MKDVFIRFCFETPFVQTCLTFLAHLRYVYGEDGDCLFVESPKRDFASIEEGAESSRKTFLKWTKATYEKICKVSALAFFTFRREKKDSLELFVGHNSES